MAVDSLCPGNRDPGNRFVDDDTGNRQRLFFNQTAGAVACYRGYCSYIGIRPVTPESTPAAPAGNITADQAAQ